MPQPRTRLVVVPVPGKPRVTLYALRVLCGLIDRSPRTIRRWTQMGWMPKPLFDLGAEHGVHRLRWFCADELELYVVLMGMHGITRGVDNGSSAFFVLLNEEYRRLRRELLSGDKPIQTEMNIRRVSEIRRMYGFIGHKSKPKRKNNKPRYAKGYFNAIKHTLHKKAPRGKIRRLNDGQG